MTSAASSNAISDDNVLWGKAGPMHLAIWSRRASQPVPPPARGFGSLSSADTISRQPGPPWAHVCLPHNTAREQTLRDRRFGHERTCLISTPVRQNQRGQGRYDRMLRHFVSLLVAQHFLDEGESSLLDNEALLASIATNYLLLPHFAISKHELQ
jgi:hypothetical protein